MTRRPLHPHQREWLELSAHERAAWAGFLRTHAQVVRELDAELEREHGVALTSYDVLVQLSLAPEGRRRMADLADAVLLSRAGTTRLVERLEREGLVERRPGRVRRPRGLRAGDRARTRSLGSVYLHSPRRGADAFPGSPLRPAEAGAGRRLGRDP